MVEVARFEDLKPGVVTSVAVAGRSVALVRWYDDAVYAVKNLCPHQSQPLQDGRSFAMTYADRAIGDVVVEATEAIISCPVHGYDFRLKDGACTATPRLRVASYPVEVRDGRVLVSPRATRRRVRPDNNDAEAS